MTTLGKYELIEELGRGGFGTVYRARDTALDVERAVKVLHPALTASPEFIERFRREGRFAARLEHLHIVPVYELGETQGSYYLVMKYLAGGSLKDLLVSSGPLPFAESVEITRQVADALTYAHQQPEKLIHRDLKPGNILFESLPNGAKKALVRLSDFGFAKALAEASTNASSASGGMLGTPAYMAPEVWRGKAASSAVDQYALACVLYEMLTGKTLFTGDSPPEIMTKHVLDGPEFPTAWPKGVPVAIEAVLRRGLSVKPEERYPDVAAFSAACTDLLAPPVVVAAAPKTEKTSPPVPAYNEPKTKPPIGASPAEEKQTEPDYAQSLPLAATLNVKTTPPLETPFYETRQAGTRINLEPEQPAKKVIEEPKPTVQQSPRPQTPVRPVERSRPSRPKSNANIIILFLGGLLAFVCCIAFAGTGGLAALLGGRPTATAIPADTDIPATATLPPQTGVFEKTIEAKNGWLDTGVLITEGQDWAITYVSGKWSACGVPYGCPYVDASGDPTMGGSETASLNASYSIIHNCYHAALIARIDSIDNSFCINNGYSGVAKQTGVLKLSINDTNLSDEDGSIIVTIQVGTVVVQEIPTPAPPVAATSDSAPTATLTPYPVAECQTDKTCIRWFVGLGTFTDQAQILAEEAVVRDFNNSQEQIQLILEVVPYASAKDTLLTEIAAGNGPDIVGPTGWVSSAALHGQWLDLRDYIAQIPSVTQDFDTALLASYNSDEGQIGLPFAVYPSAIFYNTALFDESGLAYPPGRYGDKYMLDGRLVDWDWETTVKTVAQRLTIDANGKNATEANFDKTKIVQYGFSWNFEGRPSYLGTFWANGSFTDSSGRKAQIPDGWLASWKWTYDGVWGNSPFIPNSSVSGSPDFGNGNVFGSGKIAMIDQPIWYTCCTGDVKTWDLGAMPSYQGRVNGRVDADTFRIWKGSQHPNEAFKVLTYLVTTGVQKLIIGSADMSAAYGYSMPARAKDFASWRAAKQAAFPWVKNWDLVLAGLSFPDSPSAEAYMPNYDQAWTATGSAYDKWLSTSDLNMDVEAEALKSQLQALFDGH